MAKSLRGSTAIVGVGTAGVGQAPGRTHLELLAQASASALAEAGLTLKDVDGLFTSTLVNFFPTLTVGEYLGIRPKVAGGTNLGGASFVDHVMSATLALNAGLCDVALICYGSNARSGSGKHTTMADQPPYELPYQPRMPVSAYALVAARHMHQFGTTRRHLAEVAVAARKWAQLTPEASERDPLTIDEVLAARMISDPLTIRDCCLVSDGAGAVVMVRAERARDLPQKPIYFLGGAAAQWQRQVSAMPKLGSKDVDVVQLYDAFTINVLLFLEDLGFCKKGESGAFVSDGGIAPGGRLAVNTNGGGLSYCHPGMYGIFLITEATRQLRGEAEKGRQVAGAEIALCHGNGATLSSEVTAIFGTAAAV
jgi:acetyl-CoA acetyltransferase